VHAGFFDQHAEGWHWYEVLPIEGTLEKDKKTASTKPEGFAKQKSPTDVVKAYRLELERRLNEAWIHPTPHTLKAYQEMQKDMTDRSKVFSDVWMRVIFENPSLDHTLVSPVNQKARHIQLDLEKEKVQKTIKGLSEEYGLFFFFSGGCEYCHAFAPIVKQFSETYGWEVLPISIDGGECEVFPEAILDNGLFEQWKVEVIPALFAVNPHTGHVIPIAHGMTSLDQMEVRIMKLVEGDFKR